MATSLKRNYPRYIMDALSEEFGMSKRELELVLDSQFGLASNMIKKGNTRGLKIMKFGKIEPIPSKVNSLKEAIFKNKSGGKYK